LSLEVSHEGVLNSIVEEVAKVLKVSGVGEHVLSVEGHLEWVLGLNLDRSLRLGAELNDEEMDEGIAIVEWTQPDGLVLAGEGELGLRDRAVSSPAGEEGTTSIESIGVAGLESRELSRVSLEVQHEGLMVEEVSSNVGVVVDDGNTEAVEESGRSNARVLKNLSGEDAACNDDFLASPDVFSATVTEELNANCVFATEDDSDSGGLEEDTQLSSTNASAVGVQDRWGKELSGGAASGVVRVLKEVITNEGSEVVVAVVVRGDWNSRGSSSPVSKNEGERARARGGSVGGSSDVDQSVQSSAGVNGARLLTVVALNLLVSGLDIGSRPVRTTIGSNFVKEVEGALDVLHSVVAGGTSKQATNRDIEILRDRGFEGTLHLPAISGRSVNANGLGSKSALNSGVGVLVLTSFEANNGVGKVVRENAKGGSTTGTSTNDDIVSNEVTASAKSGWGHIDWTLEWAGALEATRAISVVIV